MKIPYGSTLHGQVLSRLLDRYNFSAQQMSHHYSRYRANEEQFMAYVPAAEAEKIEKERTLKAFSVKVPYAMALAQTYTTYACTVFLGRDPVFQMQSGAGGSKQNEMAMEAILAYQVANNGCRPHLFSWINDTGLYGFSTLATYWGEDRMTAGQWVEQPETILGIETGRKKKVFERKEATTYAGNKWQTLSPYCVFPDPRVSMADYQKGEFFGVESYPGWHEIAKRGEPYQNLTEAKNSKFPDKGDRGAMYSHLKTPEATSGSTGIANSIDNKKVLRMSVDLVPSDWGLGKTSRPEKWLFEVVNDAVVIYAEPLGEIHSMHPFAVQVYEIDTASMAPRGLMDQLRDSSAILNWLFDTHIYNVRKAINNMFLVDPARINLEDLRKGDAGRLVRIKPAYQGQGVEQAIKQLQVVDVTQTHLQDVKVLMDLMQKIVGINDNMLGQLYQGRKTATEVRTSSSSGANRLQNTCRWQSAVGWERLARMLVCNTQQYMKDEQKIRIAGGVMEPEDLVVRPEDIAGFYSYIPVDGTLPIDRFALTQVWQGFLKEAMGVPAFAQKYDLVRIMGYLAQMGGINNLKRFELDPMSAPAIQQGVKDGNLVPVNQVIPNAPQS